LVLASAFVLSRYFRKYTLQIERRWHALSAGVVVAYVFVNIMPELEEHRSTVAGTAFGAWLDVEKRIYLWALAGFVAFAGLARLRTSPANDPHQAALFYAGVISGYSLYNLLIGYLLVRREDESGASLALYVLAMGLHLFMTDGELAEQFEERYQPLGRMILIFSLLLGWGLGRSAAFRPSLTSRLFAFLAGGVLITSVHAELRAERGTRFWWFVGGAAAYSTILLLI
jgi:hypothetical protein